MSTLDKAFIKAFAKDAASPIHGGAGGAANRRDAGHPHTINDGQTPLPGGPHEYGSMNRADGSHREFGTQVHEPHVYFPPPAAYADPAYVNPQYESLPHGISSAFQGQHVVPPASAAPLPPANTAAPGGAGVAGQAPPSTSGPVTRQPSPAVLNQHLAIPHGISSAIQGQHAVPPPPVAPQPPVNIAAPGGAAIAGQAPPPTSEPVTAQPSPAGPNQHLATGWTSPLSNEEARESLQTAASLKLPQPLGLPSAFEDLADEAQNQLDTETFSPDWEVDRFAWPEICESLLQVESGYFHHVGERLKTATENGRHVLMITGSRRGEGRTTLALCLSRCAAEAGVKVALVDADVKNPQLGTRLGMDTPCSWLEVIVGKAPLKETAVASIEDRLTLFPLASSEYVDMPDKRLIELLQRISRHYPLVIVDVGPLETEDHHPFADADTCPVDAAIVVRDMRNTTGQKTTATAERLQESGIQAVGIAENFKPT